MDNVLELEGWTALPEAADQMGMTRQGLHFRVNQGLIPTAYVRKISQGTRSLRLISNTYIREQSEAEATG